MMPSHVKDVHNPNSECVGYNMINVVIYADNEWPYPIQEVCVDWCPWRQNWLTI